MQARTPLVSRVILVVAIVSTTASSAHAVEVLSGPTLTMDPNGMTPLAGVVEMETDTPVEAELTITDGLDLWTVTFPGARQDHYLPVLGLKPDRSYTVEVRISPGGFVDGLIAGTGPLPADFPSITVVSTPAEMEPGLTLLDCFGRPGSSGDRYPMIVDSEGEVVWYGHDPLLLVRGIRQLENGNLFFRGGTFAKEIDLLGNWKRIVRLLHPGTALHHDLFRTPMGTYLSLDGNLVEVQNYPTSVDDPDAPTETADVKDNPVVEFLPDGTVRREWSLLERLHPTRIGYLSLRNSGGGKDWGHANSVFYEPLDDSIIVSARHQNAVVKLSRETGDLLWILGNHDAWPPAFEPLLLDPVNVPFRWQYAQHAAMTTGDGTIVLFDNGNHRASPFDGNPVVPDEENFSRGVEYEIDEDSMTVQQIWEYGEFIADPLYSGYISDADWQPTTGNVLVTFGGVTYTGGAASEDLGLGAEYARIVEVTDEVVPREVFELVLHDPTGGGISVYRSERIPGLYPQRYVDPPNGVGSTLLADREGASAEFTWTASPVDGAHDAAGYYVVYVSESPGGGFSILDTAQATQLTLAAGSETRFYKVTAANLAGTSGDEPPLEPAP